MVSTEKCSHGVYQEDCDKTTITNTAPAKKLGEGGGGDNDGRVLLCPTEESVKYKMVRVSLESLDFFLVEAETACNIQVRWFLLNNIFSYYNGHSLDLFDKRTTIFFVNFFLLRQKSHYNWIDHEVTFFWCLKLHLQTQVQWLSFLFNAFNFFGKFHYLQKSQ